MKQTGNYNITLLNLFPVSPTATRALLGRGSMMLRSWAVGSVSAAKVPASANANGELPST